VHQLLARALVSETNTILFARPKKAILTASWRWP